MVVREGYKQTEVGVIPKDWCLKALEKFAFVTKLAGFEYSLHFNSYKDEGDIVVIRGTNITHNKLDLGDVKTIPNSTSKKLLRSKLYKNDLVFAYVGTIGPIYLIEENDKFHLGPNTAKISVSNDLDSKFLYHYFTSSFIKQEILEQTSVGAQPSLSMSKIRSFRIIIPTLAEQKAIATALSDVDALISNLEKLIAKKKAIKQGVVQQLLTGKKRLPGFEQKKGFQQTEIGEIPLDWSVANIGSQCQIFGRIGFRGYTVNDIVKEDQGAITLSPSNIVNGQLVLRKVTYLSWFKYEESPEIKIYNGDILLVKTGSTYGKTALVRHLNKKATLNPQVIVLKKTKCDNRFLGYLMGFPIIQNQIESAVVGGAIPTLSQEQVSRFKLPLPSNIDEQKAIAATLSDMDTEIEGLVSKKVKAQQIKQGMMQELLTGKTRLV